MTNEPSTTALSPRAGIAMLTLQLRAALQEADALERTDHTIDEASARRQLRERLDPLLDERRRTCAAALDAARADSDAAIASARHEAHRRAALAAAAASEALAVVEPPAPVEEPDAVVETESIPEPEVTQVAPLETGLVLARPVAQEIKVSIDADAFARVFATVFASLIEQRGGQPTYFPQTSFDQPHPTQMHHVPGVLPERPRQSFWSHARHPDVLLMSLATVIVLVVLAAWLV